MNRSLIRVILPAAVLMLFSLSAAAQSRASVSAAEVNGTFRMAFKGKFRDMSNSIKVLALGGGKIRVAMDLLFPYTLRNGEMMAHLGQLDGEAAITGDTAVYKTEDGGCTITMKFEKPGTLKVTQEGTSACGFGQNVTAGGTYRKVSSKKPKFESL